jgi:peptidoglycan/xylan/chitin deacetylase (PgdA/CDA1 family)
MKRLCVFLLILSLLVPSPSVLAEEEDPLAKFAVRHGSRSQPRIAITVDDAFDLVFVWKIRDLFQDLGVVGTFFPIGIQIHEEDGAEWQKVLDQGNEIGSHNFGHYKMGGAGGRSILTSLGRFQQTLDAALGYHYQVHCFRPPFGNTADKNGRSANFREAVKRFGYEHVILWDVSQTNPEEARRRVQNGSILLYHARWADYACLKALVPQLLEKGYEFVTVSQLLGFGPNETSPEPYVFRLEDYLTEQ